MADLGQPDWLTANNTKQVIAALEAVRPGCVRFVGGCVRNTLMRRPVDDIDIATQLTPKQVLSAMETVGIRAIPTGIEHGTVTAVCDHVPFEITTLRRDIETDGRRAVVAFTEDWREDAMRRDFRLNALYAEPDGTLHDPVGGGLEDTETGRVIFIGNGDERLREDYLRILRFFRFNAWYGAGIDAEGLAACERQKEGLKQIAAERIWKEFKKLLAAPDPSEAVEMMEESGVLAEILPDAVPPDRMAMLVQVNADAGLPPDPMQRLMALLTPVDHIVASVAQSFRLSNAEMGRLENWSAARRKIGSKPLPNIELKLAFYRHGVQAIVDLLAWRDPSRDGATPKRLAEMVEAAQAWQRPEFPIGGDDALALGIQGPAIGEALELVESAWIESDFTESRDALLERLKQAV